MEAVINFGEHNKYLKTDKNEFVRTAYIVY